MARIQDSNRIILKLFRGGESRTEQRGHAAVGFCVRGAISSCTGGGSGTLCGSLHRPTAITKRGGETCLVVGGVVAPGGSEGRRGAGGGGSAARTRGSGLLCERCDILMHWRGQRHAVW